MYIYILYILYIYIYILYYMAFIAEGFFEVATEIWQCHILFRLMPSSVATFVLIDFLLR